MPEPILGRVERALNKMESSWDLFEEKRPKNKDNKISKIIINYKCIEIKNRVI